MWAKKHYIEPENERQSLENELARIYKRMETKEVTRENMMQEKDVVRRIHKLHRGEEEKWRLKSRSISLRSGDKNTKKFHKRAKSREIRNNIKEIDSVEGKALKYFKEIKKEAFSHFQVHFIEEGPTNEVINETLHQ